MATKNAALRNKMADDFAALWNTGTLQILDGVTVLATFTLSATAFAAAALGKVSAEDLPKSVAAGGTPGTADNAILTSTGAGTYVLSGLTVGTSAADVIIDNTSIAAGQTVNLTKLEWTESETTAPAV